MRAEKCQDRDRRPGDRAEPAKADWMRAEKCRR